MKSESGAVSIFVVIFATLLVTVVTVSFLRMMMNDQSQASNNDLSQSAYDSAQAGVEDAKRALLRYQQICREQGQAACDAAAAAIDELGCNVALVNSGVVVAEEDGDGNAETVGEVLIQQSPDDTASQALNQAYTCVTLQLDTEDYIGSLAANESKLVPLFGTSDFQSVQIEWFTTEDLGTASSNSVNLPNQIGSQPLHSQANWPTNRPSLLRTQFMQYGDSFTLESFDANAPTGQSNANTVFLYPTSAAAPNTRVLRDHDLRRTDPSGTTPIDTANDTPLPVRCQNSLTAGGYACSLTLTLPDLIGSGTRQGFLRLTPLYNATHFRVTLYNGAIPVPFDGVQPAIDSTGRANDLFRRVVSRVDMIDTSFPYPEASIDIGGNFCKDFAVTDSTYIASSRCTP